jgi:hypothetical protein
VIRAVVVVIVTHSKKFTIKERIFIGICWMGKATVQAALSALFLNAVKSFPDNENYDEYYSYGNAI